MRLPFSNKIARCVAALLLSGCDAGGAPAPSLDAAPMTDASEARDDATSDVRSGAIPPVVQEPIGQAPWSLHCAQSSYPAPTDRPGYVRATGAFLALALTPEHRTRAPTYGVLPGVAHGPPYEDEPLRFLTRGQAPPRDEFTRDELDARGSHIVLCALVPDASAPRGVTDDGADLPMIPAARFPLAIELGYTAGSDGIGPLREAYPYPDGSPQGVSHVTLRWTQQFAFEANKRFPLAMSFQLTIRDAMGEGYRLTMPFRATDPDS